MRRKAETASVKRFREDFVTINQRHPSSDEIKQANLSDETDKRRETLSRGEKPMLDKVVKEYESREKIASTPSILFPEKGRYSKEVSLRKAGKQTIDALKSFDKSQEEGLQWVYGKKFKK